MSDNIFALTIFALAVLLCIMDLVITRLWKRLRDETLQLQREIDENNERYIALIKEMLEGGRQ